MATPTNDSYSASSGATLYAGRYGAGTLTITSPTQHEFFQRAPTTASIDVAGTYSGFSPSSIEARFNGGAWVEIDSSPSAGVFSGTLSAQPVGQGSVEVRAMNITDSVELISVGDIFVVIGDSNHSGRATTSTVQPVAQGGISAIQYGNDGQWKLLQENTSASGAFDDDASSVYGNGSTSAAGSYFGALSNLMLANNGGIPVAFVPCAQGSTTLDSWSVTENGTNPFWEYGRALSRARDIGYTHKAALVLLGTNHGSLNEADSITAYNEIVDAWFTATGAPCVLYYAVNTLAANDAAVASVLGSNAHAIAGPDFDGAWSGTHYLTATDINTAAALAWASLETAFY